jgi:hypothetical protein
MFFWKKRGGQRPEHRGRVYLRAEDVQGDAVEKWAKEQIAWIRKMESGGASDQKEPLDELASAVLLTRGCGRVPIKLDAEAIDFVAQMVDRIAVAVMIGVILYQDANERDTDIVTGEDVKRLFKFRPSEEQWHQAWESQKVIVPKEGLANLLDHSAAYESMHKAHELVSRKAPKPDVKVEEYRHGDTVITRVVINGEENSHRE